jgi:hypothetical protein
VAITQTISTAGGARCGIGCGVVGTMRLMAGAASASGEPCVAAIASPLGLGMRPFLAFLTTSLKSRPAGGCWRTRAREGSL